MQNEPLISVIVPVYNAEKYIKQCLESILNQTYKNLEIIIVDDGSDDRSFELISKISGLDNRIKPFIKKNEGISETRNFALSKANGQYLIFVDSDDWLSKEMIQNLFTNMILYNAELSICSYNRCYNEILIPKKFETIGKITANHFQRRLVGLFGSELKDPSTTDSFVTVWGKIYLKNIIEKNEISFVSTKIIGTAEDLLFNLDYVANIESVFISNLPLYYYRKNNSDSYTNLYKKNLFSTWKRLFLEIKSRIPQEETLYKAYHNRIALSIIGLGMNELNNPNGKFEVMKNLKNILNLKDYKNAFSNLDFKYFPLHWRLFFFFAKNRWLFPLYFLLKIMKGILNSRN